MKKEIPYIIDLVLLCIISIALAEIDCIYNNSLYFWIIVLCVSPMFMLGRVYERNKVK